jgi:hypothetical protein
MMAILRTKGRSSNAMSTMIVSITTTTRTTKDLQLPIENCPLKLEIPGVSTNSQAATVA